jgi:hypothetical protein
MRNGPVFALFLLVLSAAAPLTGVAQAPLTLDPRTAPYNAKFDGKTDDTAALNAAFFAAGANGAASVVRLPANAVIKVNGNLTFDVSRVSLDCQGAVLDATGATSGATFTLTTTNHSPNLMGGIHDAHPVQNCFLSGPDSKTGVDAFHFAGIVIGGSPWMTGMVIDRVSATGYRNFIQTGPGTVALTVQNGTFGGDAHSSGTFWDVIAGNNTGEAFRALNFFVANATACFNDHGSNASNVEIFAVNFSCDGANYILTGGARPGAGSSFLTLFYSGHIEDIVAHDYAINIGNGGFDFLSGEWIGTQAGQQTHSLCKVNAPYSASAIGVRLGDIEFGDQTGTFEPYGGNRLWCDGIGPFRVTGAAGLGNTAIGLFAYANNRIANYADPAPGDFKLSGSVITDAASKPAGAASALRLTASASASIAAAVSPCQPGAIAAAAATIRTAGVGANHGTVGIQIGYLDAGGHLLASNEINLKADIPSFQYKQIVPVQLPAPPGTAFCRAQFVALSPGGAVQLWVGYPQLIVQ